MDPKAVEKAKSRLRIAQGATDDLLACKDHNEFADAWYRFLTASKGIYTVLEQGAKVSPQSRQWFGGKQSERKKDELIQYVYQARNDEEHGLEPISELVAGSTGIRGDVLLHGSFESGLHVQGVGTTNVVIEQVFEHIRLLPVRGRDGTEYAPPTSHNGKPLADRMPYTVATVALDYLAGLVSEAEARSK